MSDNTAARLRRLEQEAERGRSENLEPLFENGTATLKQYAHAFPEHIASYKEGLLVASLTLMERVRNQAPCAVESHMLALAFPPDNELPQCVTSSLSTLRLAATRPSPERLKHWLKRVSEELAREICDPIARAQAAITWLAFGHELNAKTIREEIYEARDGRWVNRAAELVKPGAFERNSDYVFSIEQTGHMRPQYFPEWSDVVKSGQLVLEQDRCS